MTTVTTFTLMVGSLIEAMPEGGARRPNIYQVKVIHANGAVLAENVKTGKLRTFPGYGRILDSEEANRTHRAPRDPDASPTMEGTDT